MRDSLWKAYVLALAGIWLVEFYDPPTDTIRELDELLQKVGLRKRRRFAPNTVFSMS